MKKKISFSIQKPLTEEDKIESRLSNSSAIDMNKIAQEMLEKIKGYAEKENLSYEQTLTKLKKTYSASLLEKSIDQIEKFQNFYSKPVRLFKFNNSYSLMVSPYQMALNVNLLTFFLGFCFYWNTFMLENSSPKELLFIENLPTDKKDYKSFKRDFYTKNFFKAENDYHPYETVWRCAVGLAEVSNFFSQFIIFLMPKNEDVAIYKNMISFVQSCLFGIIVETNPEPSLNPLLSYSNLSLHFDHLIKEIDTLDSKPEFYSQDLSIDTYCTSSLMTILGLMASLLPTVIVEIEILDGLKKLIQKFIPIKEDSIVKKIKDETEKIEKDIKEFSKECVKNIKKHHFTSELYKTLNLFIKQLAIQAILDTLETTICLSSHSLDFSQRSTHKLNIKLKLLTQKIKTEIMAEENLTVHEKFYRITTLLQDIKTCQMLVFPAIHLEMDTHFFGIRDLTCLRPYETRVTPIDDFQDIESDIDIESDRKKLNYLIKKLINGDLGVINNRSYSHNPQNAYEIQFSKELFKSLLLIKGIIICIQNIEDLESQYSRLTEFTTPQQIETDPTLQAPTNNSNLTTPYQIAGVFPPIASMSSTIGSNLI